MGANQPARPSGPTPDSEVFDEKMNPFDKSFKKESTIIVTNDKKTSSKGVNRTLFPKESYKVDNVLRAPEKEFRSVTPEMIEAAKTTVDKVIEGAKEKALVIQNEPSNSVPTPSSNKLEKVEVFVTKAKNLNNGSMFGKSDPYVVVSYNKNEFRSKTVSNNPNPTWNFRADLDITSNENLISLMVFDEDIGKDDIIGELNLDIMEMTKTEPICDQWFKLSNCKSGEILLTIKLYYVANSASGTEQQLDMNIETFQEVEIIKQRGFQEGDRFSRISTDDLTQDKQKQVQEMISDFLDKDNEELNKVNTVEIAICKKEEKDEEHKKVELSVKNTKDEMSSEITHPHQKGATNTIETKKINEKALDKAGDPKTEQNENREKSKAEQVKEMIEEFLDKDNEELNKVNTV